MILEEPNDGELLQRRRKKQGRWKRNWLISAKDAVLLQVRGIAEPSGLLVWHVLNPLGVVGVANTWHISFGMGPRPQSCNFPKR